jgi:hypothetical protein
MLRRNGDPIHFEACYEISPLSSLGEHVEILGVGIPFGQVANSCTLASYGAL